MRIFDFHAVFALGFLTAKKWPKSQKCASTGGLQGAVNCRVLAPKAWLRYEKPSKTLSKHTKQVYNAVWCIFDPYFFAWKMGIFGIFRIFWAKNREDPIFKRLKKVQFSFFALENFFSKNFGTLEQFCTFFDFLTPKTRKSRGGYRGGQKVHFGMFCCCR